MTRPLARLRTVHLIATVAIAAFIAAGLAPGLAMVGGTPPAADGVGRSVVMILGSYGTVCTATAIGRDLLLTAAHCVQPGADYKLMANKPGETPALKDIGTHRARSAIRFEAAIRPSRHRGRGAD